MSKVQQVLSWSYGEDVKPFKPPLSDAEFHTYLNHEGQLSRPEELRLRIYHGGVEPSLRKVSSHPLVLSIITGALGARQWRSFRGEVPFHEGLGSSRGRQPWHNDRAPGAAVVAHLQNLSPIPVLAPW